MFITLNENFENLINGGSASDESFDAMNEAVNVSLAVYDEYNQCVIESVQAMVNHAGNAEAINEGVWESVKAFFAKMWNHVKTFFANIVTKVKAWFQKSVSWVAKNKAEIEKVLSDASGEIEFSWSYTQDVKSSAFDQLEKADSSLSAVEKITSVEAKEEAVKKIETERKAKQTKADEVLKKSEKVEDAKVSFAEAKSLVEVVLSAQNGIDKTIGKNAGVEAILKQDLQVAESSSKVEEKDKVAAAQVEVAIDHAKNAVALATYVSGKRVAFLQGFLNEQVQVISKAYKEAKKKAKKD